MINENDIILLDDFTNEMIKILQEKLKKYGNAWKTTDLGILKYKLDNQVNKCHVYRPTKSDAKRKCLHIAIYSFFLYNRLAYGKIKL